MLTKSKSVISVIRLPENLAEDVSHASATAIAATTLVVPGMEHDSLPRSPVQKSKGNHKAPAVKPQIPKPSATTPRRKRRQSESWDSEADGPLETFEAAFGPRELRKKHRLNYTESPKNSDIDSAHEDGL